MYRSCSSRRLPLILTRLEQGSNASTRQWLLGKPWDDMHVSVHDLLPRDRPTVPSNVISFGVKCGIHPCFHFLQELKSRLDLLLGHVEYGRPVSFRNNDARVFQSALILFMLGEEHPFSLEKNALIRIRDWTIWTGRVVHDQEPLYLEPIHLDGLSPCPSELKSMGKPGR